VPLKNILAAAAIVFMTLSGCATSGSDNTTYAQPQGIGPVRGDMGGYWPIEGVSTVLEPQPAWLII
jgi:hypothetical protein